MTKTIVSMSAEDSPPEVLALLAKDKDEVVRRAVARRLKKKEQQ